MIETTDILGIVTTKDEANQLQIEITNLIEALYGNKPFEELVDEYISYEKKDTLHSLLKKHQIDIKNTSQTQHFLQEIKDTVPTIPVVGITIAFSPKKQLLSTLSGWFVVHTKKAVLIDISIDRFLLGGIIITYNGLYKDYSLKKYMEEKYKSGMDTLFLS
jgi:F0F1-type ATP synthase delta subunit